MGRSRVPKKLTRDHETAYLCFQMVLSIAVVIVGFVLVFVGDEVSSKTGAGFIGVVIGYWLR